MRRNHRLYINGRNAADLSTMPQTHCVHNVIMVRWPYLMFSEADRSRGSAVTCGRAWVSHHRMIKVELLICLFTRVRACVFSGWFVCLVYSCLWWIRAFHWLTAFHVLSSLLWWWCVMPRPLVLGLLTTFLLFFLLARFCSAHPNLHHLLLQPTSSPGCRVGLDHWYLWVSPTHDSLLNFYSSFCGLFFPAPPSVKPPCWPWPVSVRVLCWGLLGRPHGPASCILHLGWRRLR